MVPSIFHSYPRVSSPPSGYPQLCHGSRICVSARPLANGHEGGTARAGKNWEDHDGFIITHGILIYILIGNVMIKPD